MIPVCIFFGFIIVFVSFHSVILLQYAIRFVFIVFGTGTLKAEMLSQNEQIQKKLFIKL